MTRWVGSPDTEGIVLVWALIGYIAGLASLIPMIHASRVDPAVALRAD